VSPVGRGFLTATVAPPGGWAYHLLVLLHVICAVGGFGALSYRGFSLDLARRRGGAAAAGALSVYGQISQVGEALLYATVLFGGGAIAASGNHSYFDRAWVFAAIGVFVAMVALLHGLVRPAERRYRSVMLALANVPGMKPPARPPQLDELDRLQRRVGAGMGLFNLCLLGALYLMVFKP